MPQFLSVKRRGIFRTHKFREWVGGMLEGIGRERQQCLDRTGNLPPTAQAVPETGPPSLSSKCHLDGVQQGQFRQMRKQAVFCIDPVNDPSQLSNRARGTPLFGGEFGREGLQPRRSKRLPLQTLQYL